MLLLPLLYYKYFIALGTSRFIILTKYLNLSREIKAVFLVVE